DLGEDVKEFLIDFQEKYNYYLNSEELDEILHAGRDKAARKADKMVEKMERAMGLRRKRRKQSVIRTEVLILPGFLVLLGKWKVERELIAEQTVKFHTNKKARSTQGRTCFNI